MRGTTDERHTDALLAAANRARGAAQHRRRRLITINAFAGLSLVALAACGSTSTPASTSATASASASARPSVVPLTVYSAQGYDSVVTKAFTAATGIPVKLDDDSTGPLLTKIAAERNNPQWGLLWVDGDTAFAALDQQGQLLDYTSPRH